MKEISGIKLAQGLTPHEIRKNGWTEDEPIEGIFQEGEKHAAVIFGAKPLDGEIEFFNKNLPCGDDVFGVFQAEHKVEDNPWAAAIAKGVSSNRPFPPIRELGDLPQATDHLSIAIDQAHSVIYQHNQRTKITQSIASAILLRTVRGVQDGENHRNFIVSVNLGKGKAFRVPKDYINEKIEPLFVEHVDLDGELLVPVIGQDGVDIAPHPPIEADEGDRVVLLSGPVKPDLYGDTTVYDEIREALATNDNNLEVATSLAEKRKKIGEACLAAVIEI